MGIPLGAKCDGIIQLIDFDWQVVTDDGAIVQSGRYEVGGYGPLENIFGDFRTTSHKRYRVLLNVRRDAGELNAARPALIVELGGEYSEGLYALTSYTVLWAKYVGGAGLLWIFIPILLRAVGWSNHPEHPK